MIADRSHFLVCFNIAERRHELTIRAYRYDGERDMEMPIPGEHVMFGTPKELTAYVNGWMAACSLFTAAVNMPCGVNNV